MKYLLGVFFLFTALIARGTELNLDLQHFVEEIEIPAEFSLGLDDFNTQPVRDDGEELKLSEIFNIAAKVWKVIKDNEAVLNVKYDYANALPKGLKNAEELDGFSPLVTRAYRMWGKNLYGMRVYDVKYVAVHRFGGSYRGVGKYIENASVVPTSVSVLWGYTLNYEVTNANAVNIGTRENPIASLLLNTEISVSTLVKKATTRKAFEFRGDSAQVRVIE